MDEHGNTERRTSVPRRRKRTRAEIIKETYLPTVIVCTAVLFILIIICGAIVRGFQQRKADQLSRAEEALTQQELEKQWNMEADGLIAEATLLAENYDYDGALAKLDSFSGDKNFARIAHKRSELEAGKAELVLWEDNSKIPNLSFMNLVVDPVRAFRDEVYGNSYKTNYVTISEFNKIIQQLYDNGYILISMDDILDKKVDSDGSVHFTEKQLYLPAGKKPLLLSQNQVNYYVYMVDGDGDYIADKHGDGFACRLLVDETGSLACEIINSDGSRSVGAYDLVPLLDSFILTHPDFSYKGAKAILSVSGCEGVFGYRTSAEADSKLGTEYRAQQEKEAAAVIEALRADGYDIACYTYENIAYGESDAPTVQADLDKWASETAPLLGDVDMFLFAKKSDIGEMNTEYAGEKFDMLTAKGFHYFFGFCDTGSPWMVVTDSYVRQGRILVNGANLQANPKWFADLFSAESVIDPIRA